MTPSAVIASAVRRERSRAGLSLSALAGRAGLSKSTLSQLEAGHGNPGVETLWAIAGALDVPFSFLFEAPETQPQLIRAGDAPVVAAEGSAFAASLLSAGAPGRRRDLYTATLDAGAVRTAAAHPAGTLEHVLLLEGCADVGPEAATARLAAGDYYRYPADVPHRYATVAGPARLLIVMDAPG
jgi:transcriptional regulator with XRE-family HTH domain